jgi:orotate phosphoribosyltransferase
MTSEAWLARFRRRGAVADGHFLLSSGLHSPIYIQSALILQYPEEAQALGAALAERLRPLRAQVVIGPALGAVVVAHEVARALGVRAIFAERDGGQMALRRGFAIAEGERVLVVEDVVTTGGSAAEVASLVRAAGGEVVGFGALVDRTGGRMDLEAHLEALITLDLPTFAPDRCPQCREGIPAVKPGSRPTPD